MTQRDTEAGAGRDPDGRLARARTELWRAVQARDEHAARLAVFGLLDGGATAESALLDVIAPVQAKVGAEWAADRISVAQEHAATAIHDRIIAAMAHRDPPPAARAARAGAVAVTIACVDGEWHALPARILAEVLRGRGHRVDFLGAQVPTPHLVAHLHRTAPGVLALSSSIPTRLPQAHTAVTAVQAIGIPVLAGGAAFGRDGRYARLLGADAWAPDARAAADLLDRGVPRPFPAGPRQVGDDLPHLTDQEYTLVTRNKRQLVKNTLAGLEERLPGMQAYTDAQRERTAEDIAHIVDFLATALYTDAVEVFTDFIGWTGDVLEARRVPATALLPGLDVLGEELKDFPRALDFLARGRDVIDARDPRPPIPLTGTPA
ncbi:cobalamin B12-binding domain-containing protein [Streptomyces roseolilacinus]|uniref:Cobalamin-binding protein n=1 Tax=Streptomyces roseolilacinus TaxID=66904 RepID=A0A918AZ84_9ACTN|nr:cobalamin B12-binding domain-containing protein [Streptomyces roseolilacinus]GGP96110.1 cobalamin-binding protein [Streptomyces roseolilacinus]